MPIYEYFCEPCQGIFELLRPVREAGAPQPCPQCDADARRIMSTEFQAFTLRKGLYRRLPDRGTHWHYRQEVSGPITGAAPAGEHPELRRRKLGPDRIPTTEEREAFAHGVEQRLEHEAEALASGRAPIRDLFEERKAKAFTKRVASTSQRARVARRRAANADTTPRTSSGQHGPKTASE